MRGIPIVLFLFAPLLAFAQVTYIESQPNGIIRTEGKLEAGQPIQDLSWAWNSQNACFVETQKAKFTGHHVLYQTTLPVRAELHIRVIPKNKEDNFSLYAYTGNGKSIVPELYSCVSCEADYKWDYKYRGKTQDHRRQVSLRAVNNPYTVTIGVVGAEGLSSGAFTLELELVGGESPQSRTQLPVPTYRLQALNGQPQTYKGDLSEGVPIHDLSWAWSSQNACFVAPRASSFNGHHLLYLTELPPNTELTITLQAEDEQSDLSLYAYSHAGSEYKLVPGLRSCVSCEADFASGLAKGKNPSRTVSLRAVNNPYKVVIGVAGAQSLDKGSFTLTLSTR